MRTLSFLFILALSFSACQNTESQEQSDNPEAENEEQMADGLVISPFSKSQQYPDATLESVAYEGGKFNFGIANYELTVQTPDAGTKMCANSAQGQHIHLIMNNEPYAAKYEPEFDYELDNGEHYMLAFLSRSYHESIKTDKAHLAKKVTVKDGAFEGVEDITEPMLFYSRPKGNYVGEKNTKKVMLDFYPVNVELGENYKVKASINGEEHVFDVWQPYFIEGLPMGENEITLTLVDGQGNAVDAPLNPVTRKFTLKADPASKSAY